MNKLIWKKNLLEDKFGEDSKQFVGGVMGEKRDWLNMIWTVIYCAAQVRNKIWWGKVVLGQETMVRQ